MSGVAWPTDLQPTVPARWALQPNVARARTITGMRVTDWGHHVWTADLTFGPYYPRLKAQRLHGFLTSLARGQPVTMPIHHQDVIPPAGGGGPRVHSGHVGNTIDTYSWPGSDQLVLQMGWLFSWYVPSKDRYDLYMVTEDVVSVGSDATIKIEPPIQVVTTDQGLLYREYGQGSEARATMRLMNPEVARDIGSVLGHSTINVQLESWGTDPVP